MFKVAKIANYINQLKDIQDKNVKCDIRNIKRGGNGFEEFQDAFKLVTNLMYLVIIQCKLSYVSFMVSTKQKPRVDTQKKVRKNLSIKENH